MQGSFECNVNVPLQMFVYGNTEVFIVQFVKIVWTKLNTDIMISHSKQIMNMTIVNIGVSQSSQSTFMFL